MIETTAFWGFTINNYDETDLALVQQGYPDYVREIVYTLEKGEEGTPHIQGWLKLQRQQRLSFVKKLFPRGHFKALMKAEYDLNTKRYAQKLDDTAVAGAVHKFNDPMNTIEVLMKKVIIYIIEHYEDEEELGRARNWAESDMVKKDYKLAKIFVSATYKQMWKQFGHEMFECVCKEYTHTHTHTEEKSSCVEDYNNAEGNVSRYGAETEDDDQREEEDQDYEDDRSETTSRSNQSRSSSSSSSYASEEYGE